LKLINGLIVYVFNLAARYYW